ncbi:MAG: T9SS C-terminal target domain-containing protein, partial [Marinilabiliales bacterium]
DLEPGLYAWSVQAVDHSFAGGEFAEEGVFYIPGPPTVVTQATTGVSESTATLNAMVNALGLETTVWFEYGTGEGDHENWETAEADPPTIDGTDETPVSASLDGLQANTYYYFRAAAQNDLGTTYGHDGVLFTSDPPGVTTLDADNIEPFSATLRGSVVPRNLETDVWFEYGLTAEELDNTAGATSSPVDGEYATEVEADIDGLLANEIYYFRVAAESFSGLSEGDIKQFTTAMAAPGAATLAASDITSTSAVLNASVMPHNLTTTVSFEYGKQSGRYDEWESVSTTYLLEGQSSQDVEAMVTLEPAIRYYYRVRAENSAGTGYGDQRQLVTLDMAPEVTTKDATDIHRTGATLNGMVNPNNSETSVTFKYGLTDAIDQSWLSADVSGTFDGNQPVAVSVDVIGLDENTPYYFVISATNSGGTSTGEIKGFSTSAPIVAIGDATGITTSSAMLNATVNSNNYAAVYWFEYGTDPQLEQAQTTEPGDIDPGDEELPVIATVTGLEPNTVYYFRVVAESINGRSVSSINELHTDCDWDIICSTPSGPDQLCQGTGSTTFETSSETALEYQWRIEPPGAGSVTGNGETATVTWNSDYSGQASIYVRGYDGVCNSVESDPLVVTINPLPDPALISGDDNVCPGSYGNVYSIEPSEGSSYSWSAVGGTLLEEHDGGFARIHWGDNTDTPRVSVTETIDATGCSRENIMDVIIAGSPAPEKPDIRVKGRIHILISSVNADAYQWFMDNEIIAGATGKYYIAREAAGMYMLRISEGQCHSFSDPLGIPLNKKLHQVEEMGSVFPNPSEGIITYELSGEVYGLLRIRITDNNGRVVHTGSADKSEYSINEQINMQNLRSGVYFLEAAVDGEVVDVQVLVKN